MMIMMMMRRRSRRRSEEELGRGGAPQIFRISFLFVWIERESGAPPRLHSGFDALPGSDVLLGGEIWVFGLKIILDPRVCPLSE
jgi:hypothetical protein